MMRFMNDITWLYSYKWPVSDGTSVPSTRSIQPFVPTPPQDPSLPTISNSADDHYRPLEVECRERGDVGQKEGARLQLGVLPC